MDHQLQPAAASRQEDLKPQTLYDRSRESGFELLKHLVSLATGGVGVCFVALSAKVEPPLKPNEQIALVCTLSLMTLAVLTGTLGWAMDARFYNFWARKLRGDDPERDERKKENAWLARTIFFWLLALFFLGGVLAAMVYVILRMSQGTSPAPFVPPR